MINLHQKNLHSVSNTEKKYLELQKTERHMISSEEFYWFLETDTTVPLVEIEENMTYKIHVNLSNDNLSEYEFGSDNCYCVIGRCVKVFKFGDEVLLAKFDTKGGSTVVRGNYGLLYYCLRIVH